MQNQQAGPNILADIEQEILLEPAAPGVRFVNLLIDTLAYYGIMLLVGVTAGIILENVNGNVENSFLLREDVGSLSLQYLLSLVTYLGMFTILEGSAKGKTLGKLVTGSRARRLDGSPITWKDAFMRSLCRIVPFEAFSALGGKPWHDRWTNTIVVNEKR